MYYAKNVAFQISQNKWITENYSISLYCDRQNKSFFSNLPESIKVKVGVRPDNTFGKIYKALYYLLSNTKYVYLGAKDLPRLGIRNIFWVADFQHRCYPHFFSKNEYNERDRRIASIANNGSPLVVSSQDCKKHYEEYYLEQRKKNSSSCYVMPFVSYIEPEIKMLSALKEEQILESKGIIAGKYAVVMNQF